jgi:phosphatidylinositol alpha-mannosyltransferase
VKILLVNPYDLTHPGGVTNHVFDIAEQFRLMGHEADIIGPAGQGLLPQNGYTHSVGNTMRVISPGDRARLNASPFIYGAVEKFLRNREYDVYHLHEPFLGFLGPAVTKLGKGVMVGTFHTTREGPHIPYILGWPLVRHWNKRLHGHIAVAESAKRTAARYVKGDFRIIPNGVNFDRFATRQPIPPHLSTPRHRRRGRPARHVHEAGARDGAGGRDLGRLRRARLPAIVLPARRRLRVPIDS